MNMRNTFRWLVTTWSAGQLLILTSSLAFASTISEPDKSGVCSNNMLTGVLTKCAQSSFGDYVRAVLTDDMPYIIVGALFMIIWSGIEYMLSGIGSPDGQKRAKQRIVSILSGVALLILADLLLNQLASNLTNY